MIVDVVRAEGAPGPTLAIDRDRLPGGALALRDELTAVRGWSLRTGRGHIRKIGLYGVSDDPAYDLDYRFVQALPSGSDGFDFRTGCGHSLLACVVAAGLPGAVRVRAVTTRDTVECVPEPATGRGGAYTVRLVRPTPLPALLPTGRPLDLLCGLPVSVVDFGNPYVFVGADALGLRTRRALREAGPGVLRRLRELRAAAARSLGRPPHSALPKVAVVGGYAPGQLAVRAVTVSGWHPSLALTGALCLTAARAVPGTLPHLLAPTDGGEGDTSRIHTPGGVVTTSADVRDVRNLRDVRGVQGVQGVRDGSAHAPAGRGPVLHSAAVHHKRAHVIERAAELPWRIHVTA
ncbi:PrpF domain-containing protein [Streptomyces sp. O3]